MNGTNDPQELASRPLRPVDEGRILRFLVQNPELLHALQERYELTMSERALTEDELNAIEARCAAATPGPWRVGIPTYKCTAHPDGRHGDTAGCVFTFTGEWYVKGEHNSVYQDKDYRAEKDEREGLVAGMWDWEDGGIQRPEDATFIAAARSDVPDLVAEIRRLREYLRGGNAAGDVNK